MNKILNRIKIGIIDENPILVQVLGMCPTLAVTSYAVNGFGMGMATTAVLIGSNLVISILRNIIPAKVRIPAFIVVIASFVTMIDLFLQAFASDLHASLGLFIPLIVVNCIVLGRAEAFASKNNILMSVADALGNGLGFTLALTVLGSIRELLGTGGIFGFKLLSEKLYKPMTIFVLNPGAFLVLGMLFAAYTAIMNKFAKKKQEKEADA